MGWWREYEPSRRRPVKDGIKTKSQRGKIGTTWWASRWIGALEAFTDSARLGRGRTYARAGQVMSLEISPGLVKARVQGSRPTPYKVEMRLAPLNDAQWEKVTDAMAEQAVFAAKLLAGEMPQNIEEAFQAAGVPLFPQKAKDLATDCSCPDWANPCKHVAAVHYILGDQFDEDPFLIFRLRGRDRDAIIAGLRARRSTGAAEAPAPEEAARPETAPLEAASFWGSADRPDGFRAQIRPPAIEEALLKRLGPPAFGAGKIDPAEALADAYRILSRRALALAYGEEEEPQPRRGGPSVDCAD